MTKMSASATIGINLRKRRAVLALSQAALASKSGLSRPVISAIEQGRANPTLSALERVCVALNMRVVDLLVDTAHRSTVSYPRYSPAGRKPSYRHWLSHPPAGSKAAKARDFGVDLSLLVENLSLTPTERLEKMSVAAATVEAFRSAAKRRRR